MNKTLLSTLLFSALVAGFAPAQTVPPLVKFPSGDAAWSVELAAKTSPSPDVTNPPKEDRRLQSVRIDRFNNLRRDQTTWTDGSRTETWSTVTPRLLIYLDARINEIVTATPGDELDIYRFDESAFDWIQPANRVDRESLGNTRCAVYEGLAYAGSGRQGRKFRVWIDEETLLPRQLETEGTKYAFTFHEKADVPLVMTEAFQTKLNRYRNALASPTRVGKRDRSTNK